jgi:transposase
LREWVLRDRKRRGQDPAAPPTGGRRTASATETESATEPDERIRQPEARVAELEASERKLATERDILRKAAKYFAGETNW